MFNRHHKTVHFFSLYALKTPYLEMHKLTHLDNILPLKTCPDIVRHICTLLFLQTKKVVAITYYNHMSTGMFLKSQSYLCPVSTNLSQILVIDQGGTYF